VEPSPEARLGTFVAETRADDIPPEALLAARRQLVDTLGVAVAAAGEPVGAAVRSILAALSGEGPASVLGLGRGQAWDQAAWANGTLAHALDYDDSGFSHPSACIVPAALAVAEAVDASIADLVVALVFGYEVFERVAKVGRFDDRRIRESGIHPTAIYGTLGAAAAAARLLGLGAEGVGTALSVAAAEGSGLTQHFGSWAKGLGAGAAARSGVTSAYLARAGFDADPAGISGRYGLFSAVHGSGRWSFEGFDADLGTRWSIVDPGLAIKLYPSCGINRRAVDALVAIREREGITGPDIDSITVHVHPDVFHTLRFRAPLRGFQGKFSLDYNIASAALDGTVTIDSFSDAAAARPELRQLLGRIHFVEHPEWDKLRYRELPLEVVLRDGRDFAAAPTAPRGSRTLPLTDDEVRHKFVTCVDRVLPDGVSAWDRWWSGEPDHTVRDALTALVPPRAARQPYSPRG
jgi:2-methylcitrate dehydratase PrpD